MKKKFLVYAAVLASSLGLVACGGGGGGDSGTGGGTTSTAQSLSPAVFQGTVSGFGSVVVNGVRFSQVGAPVTDDEGQSLQSGDLHIGSSVRVFGQSDELALTGTADRIEVIRGTQGLVSQLDVGTSSFTVLGQKVSTNANTAYQGLSGYAALAVSDPVEVQGSLQGDGSLLATLVEKKALAGSAVRVSGVVANLDAAGKRFTLGALTVSYSTADAVSGGLLRDGALVKVRALAARAAGSSTLLASAVKVIDGADVFGTTGVGTLVKIGGAAQAAPVNGLLKVAGVAVDVSKAVFKGGSATIARGSLLEIKGSFLNGTLVASVVEFDGFHEQQTGGRNELFGVISQWTSVANFVVSGVTVDASAAPGAPTLSVGSYVELKGNMQGNVLKASRLELRAGGTEPTGGSFEMKGVVSGFVSVADFILNGVHVDASRAVFEHNNAAIFGNGRTVEVKGALNLAGVFIASKADAE